jgi:hypothetical protein
MQRLPLESKAVDRFDAIALLTQLKLTPALENSGFCRLKLDFIDTRIQTETALERGFETQGLVRNMRQIEMFSTEPAVLAGSSS